MCCGVTVLTPTPVSPHAPPLVALMPSRPLALACILALTNTASPPRALWPETDTTPTQRPTWSISCLSVSAFIAHHTHFAVFTQHPLPHLRAFNSILFTASGRSARGYIGPMASWSFECPVEFHLSSSRAVGPSFPTPRTKSRPRVPSSNVRCSDAIRAGRSCPHNAPRNYAKSACADFSVDLWQGHPSCAAARFPHVLAASFAGLSAAADIGHGRKQPLSTPARDPPSANVLLVFGIARAGSETCVQNACRRRRAINHHLLHCIHTCSVPLVMY